MENQAVGPYKNATRFGTYLGLSLIIFSVLLYLFGLQFEESLGYLQFVIYLILIILGTKHHRDAELGGYISYGRALGTGTLIAFFAGVLFAFYFFFYVKYVDLDFLPKALEKAEQSMFERGLNEDEVEQQMKWTIKFMQPLPFSLLSILGNTFWGFIFSLITSIFLKKKDPSFQGNFR